MSTVIMRARDPQRMTKLEKLGGGRAAGYSAVSAALASTTTIQEAAKLVGVSRNTFYRYMKRYDLEVV